MSKFKTHSKNETKFFNSKKERDLWIKLNAQLINYFHITINNHDDNGLGNIDAPYSPMWISRNQLVYDENTREKPRFSLEELSSLSYDELIRLTRKQHQEEIKKIFPNFLGFKENEIL